MSRLLESIAQQAYGLLPQLLTQDKLFKEASNFRRTSPSSPIYQNQLFSYGGHIPVSMPWFCFRIRHIKENSPHNQPPNTDRHDYWRLPYDHNHFRESHDTVYELNNAQWQQDLFFPWRPGTVSLYSPRQHGNVQPYKCASLFWNRDSHSYLLLPFDCTRRSTEPPSQSDSESSPTETSSRADTANVSGQTPHTTEQAPISWQRLKFRRDQREAALSFVGYSEEYQRLGAPVDERWIRFLLPATNFADPDPSQTRKAQLGGELTIVLGLIAFCTDKRKSIKAIQDSFFPSTQKRDWRRTDDMEPFADSKFLLTVPP